ncbi:3-phenylpropionate/trans-cinnamate dioxygenase ferredoxin reductase subunit [Nitrobacteraceae bacterium AZCC 1564]
MSSSGPVIIAGAGQAGFQVASSLRDEGFAGDVLLIGEEPEFPYQRPPLSKAALEANHNGASVFLRPPKFFEEKKIGLQAGKKVVSIDRAGGSVTTCSGERIPYQHLVLATGTRNRTLDIPGSKTRGVFYLRTIADARGFGEQLERAKRLVIIGAGFIGMEVAATARKRSIDTTVLDIAPRPMARAITAATANFFHNFHSSLGTKIRLGVEVSEIVVENGAAAGVLLQTGERVDADLILVGIGVIANSELASEAGLAVQNGILVDEYLKTEDQNISAVGDCAAFPVRSLGNIRIESVQNATDQARCVAARLAGRVDCYTNVPWFWSDQSTIKLQIVGLVSGHDDVLVAGSPDEACFSAFCFRNGSLVGIESVNRPADHMAGRRLLRHGIPISQDQVEDFKFDVKALEAYARTAALEACP